MQIEMKLASESHVPRFRAGVGTWRSRYMILIRLPWRHRARPSATLHEIQSAPKGKLVLIMLQRRMRLVNQQFWIVYLGWDNGLASGGRGASFHGPVRRRSPSASASAPVPATGKSGKQAWGRLPESRATRGP